MNNILCPGKNAVSVRLSKETSYGLISVSKYVSVSQLVSKLFFFGGLYFGWINSERDWQSGLVSNMFENGWDRASGLLYNIYCGTVRDWQSGLVSSIVLEWLRPSDWSRFQYFLLNCARLTKWSRFEYSVRMVETERVVFFTIFFVELCETDKVVSFRV